MIQREEGDGMSRKLTKSGTALIVVGGIVAIVGLISFLRVFLAMGRGMNDPFMPFRSPAIGRAVPYEGAVVGVILLGVGSYLVKIGLGLTLVGHSDSIASWLRRLVGGERRTGSCTQCRQSMPTSANYCSRCGARLE